MFKHTVFFTFKSDLTNEQLETALAEKKFIPCDRELSTQGFDNLHFANAVKPDPKFTYAVKDYSVICYKTEKKILPASVVKAELRKKEKSLEEQQGFSVGKRQSRELKELVIAELLPRAFSRINHVKVLFNLKDKWIAVDSSTQSVVDDVVSLLVRALPDAGFHNLQTNKSPAAVFTEWLSTQEPTHGFTLDDACILLEPGECKRKVSFSHHTLDNPLVMDHLTHGKIPMQLGVSHEKGVSLVLTDKGYLKRITYLDLIKDQMAKEMETIESQDEMFQADVLMLGDVLSVLKDDFVAASDGLVVKE